MSVEPCARAESCSDPEEPLAEAESLPEIAESDYVPSEVSDSDGQENEYQGPVQDRKFIVFEHNLDDLLQRCLTCGQVRNL